MRCLGSGSAAVRGRPERTLRGYRRFRCRECGRQFNERSAGLLNRTHYPSDVIALVVLWRLRYKAQPTPDTELCGKMGDGGVRKAAYRGGWKPA